MAHVLRGAHSPTGRLYEIVDRDGTVLSDVTMESILAGFEGNA